MLCSQAAKKFRDHPNFEAVPETPQFDAEWLTRALQRDGGLPAAASVASVSVGEIVVDMEGEELKNGGGLAGGQTVRVKDIEYGGSLSAEERARLPRSLIQKHIETDNTLKEAPLEVRMLWTVLLGGVGKVRGLIDAPLRREIETYRNVCPTLPVRTPKLYYSELDGHLGKDWGFLWRPHDSLCLRSIMLLEDLSTSGFSSCGHAVLDWQEPLDGEVQKEAFRCMARLHAWGWGGRGMEPTSGLEPILCGGLWVMGFGVLKPFAKDDKQLIQFLDHWSDRPEWGMLREPDVLAMLFDLRANTGRWIQRVLDKDQQQTVVHGDFHRGNIFAKTKDDGSIELALFDWSFIGTGACTFELIYFMFLGGGRPDAVEESQLLEVYHEALMAAKPDCGYSLQQLKIDFKLQLLSGLVMWLCDHLKVSKVGERDFNAEQGEVTPTIDSVTEKQTRATLQWMIARGVAYHKDQSQWDDYFSGAGPTAAYAERTAEQAAAAQAALKAAVQQNVAKRREGKAKQDRKTAGPRDGGTGKAKGGASGGGGGTSESLLASTP